MFKNIKTAQDLQAEQVIVEAQKQRRELVQAELKKPIPTTIKGLADRMAALEELLLGDKR